MRSLDALPADELQLLEVEVERDGQVAINDILLPIGCSPSATTLTAVKIDERIEIFVPTNVVYSGQRPFWRQRLSAEPVAGVARLLLGGPTLVDALGELAPHMVAEPDSAGSLTELDAVRIRRNEQRPVSAEQISAALQREIRGQDTALQMLAERVQVQLQKSAPRRPLSLLLVGSTGVGKTGSIQKLAAVLGELERDACRFHRIDMNEYAEASRASMLLGAPPGYIGYGDGGLLVDALSADGRAVVLFDEIEKAHPQVLQILMNLMDAGRLSHPRGRGEAIDARSAILCFTSNAKADELRKRIANQQGANEADAVIRSVLAGSGFLPEFVGRLSACLHFKHLSDEAIIEIAALSVAKVAAEYGLEIEYIAPEVVQRVVDVADAGRFGARMIEYAVERQLAPLFAKHAGAERGPLRLLSGPLRLIAQE